MKKAKKTLSVLLTLVFVICLFAQGLVVNAAGSDNSAKAYKNLTKCYKMVKEQAAIESLGIEFANQGKTYKSADKAVEEFAEYVGLNPTDVWETYQLAMEEDKSVTKDALIYLGSYPQLGAALASATWLYANENELTKAFDKGESSVDKIKDDATREQFTKYKKKIANYFSYLNNSYNDEKITSVKLNKKIRSYESSINKVQKSLEKYK